MVNRLQKSQKKVPISPKLKNLWISFLPNVFTSTGGFFLYNDSLELLLSNFNNICIENDFEKSEVLCLKPKLAHAFQVSCIENPSLTLNNYKALLINCEYLISNTGKILLSNQQIHHFKLNELPKTLIVTANIKQLTRDVSEGMTLLKNKYKNTIPTNITTLKTKPRPAEDKKNLTSTGNTKNIYLLLKDF